MASRAEVEFSTSGQSGEPVRWLRTVDQLRTEVEVVAADVLGEVDRVVNFAPPRHLFGRLFGDLLPRLRGIEVQPLWADQLALPVLPEGERTLFVCLPASWRRLRGVVDQIAKLPDAIALHGTGPTVSSTDEVVTALSDTAFRAVEVFGSTETGGVAVRDIAPGRPGPRPWRLLPDVDFVAESEPVEAGMPDAARCLHVRSPRIARRCDMDQRPESWRLDDLVRPVGDGRHFEFVGRRSRLVKVNGIRCDLAHVEDILRSRYTGLDLVCVAVSDTMRGEHYELCYADPVGDTTPDQMWCGLASALGGFPVPRVVHRLDRIPRSAVGKPEIGKLREAIDHG